MGERNRWFCEEVSRRIAGSALALVVTSAVSGCDSGDGASGGYPSLRSVPEVARASTPVDERRDIVRGLIEERDQSRRQTSVVRSRSGLDVGQLPALSDDDIRAEDVVPDAPVGDGEGFRLTPGEGGSAGSVYRGQPQFEDGSLDDFIRKLKRETLPSAPSEDPAGAGQADEPASDDTQEEDVDARWLDSAPAPTMLLAAIAPVFGRGADRHDVVIRLAAAEEEPGFFCGYFGWTVAWSSMCVDETQAPPVTEGDEGVGADLGEEAEGVQDDAATDGRRSTRSRSSTSDEARQERVERRLSEEDAAEAIENAGRSALAPVTSSLDKLRDFIEARRERSSAPSLEERSPALRRADPSLQAAVIDRPPLPRSRPKQREDISITDRGETFDFVRTPRPHFKPERDDLVILPPAGEGREDDDSGRASPDRPHRPHFKPAEDAVRPIVLPPEDTRPREPMASNPRSPPSEPSPRSNDLVAERATSPELSPKEVKERLDAALATLTEGVADIEMAARTDAQSATAEEASPLKSETPTAVSPKVAEPIEPQSSSLAAIEPAAPPEAETSELAPLIITFEPETPGLPEGIGPRLATLLTHARTTDRKIHIIGEASTNHLARRRATDVGAALVQLGATVEILEYDHQARTGVDQVRLVLRSAAVDTPVPTAGPAPIEK